MRNGVILTKVVITVSRSLKQFIYGVFYLGIFALVLFGIYSSSFKPLPSCFDGKLNQNETDIDCGGPCISCEEMRLRAPKVTAPVRVFSLSSPRLSSLDGARGRSGQVVLLAEIANPNSTYGATVDYRFHLYDRSGTLLETIIGRERLYPSERTYVYEPNVTALAQDISRVELEFGEPLDGTRGKLEWVVASEMPYPTLAVSRSETVVEDEGRVRVTGVVRNETPVIAREVNVIAVLFDSTLGAELFASQTVITDIGGFDEKSFTVLFPSDSLLRDQVDVAATKIFFNVQ